MPYAGSTQKVTKIDSHSAWLNDHHRKMFGGVDDLVASSKNEYQWQTTHNSKFQVGLPAPTTSAGVPTWPVGSYASWEGESAYEDQRIDQNLY